MLFLTPSHTNNSNWLIFQLKQTLGKDVYTTTCCEVYVQMARIPRGIFFARRNIAVRIRKIRVLLATRYRNKYIKTMVVVLKVW